MTDIVTVEQCDREAAQSLADDNTLCDCDKCIPVYAAAFALHRIAERERCALLCWKAADDLAHAPRPEYDDHQQFENGRMHQASVLALAIREPKP